MRASLLSIWYNRRRVSSKIIIKAPAGFGGSFFYAYGLQGEAGSVTIYSDEQNCKTNSSKAQSLQFRRDDTVAVSIEKLHEIIDLFAQFYAFVSVGYQHTVCGHLNDLCCGFDVGTT